VYTQPKSSLDQRNPLDDGVIGIDLKEDGLIVKYTARTKNGELYLPEPKVEDIKITVGEVIEMGQGKYIDKYEVEIGSKVIVGQFSGMILEGIYGEGVIEKDGQEYHIYHRLVAAKDIIGTPRYDRESD